MAIDAAIYLNLIRTPCPDCGASNAFWIWHDKGVAVIGCACQMFVAEDDQSGLTTMIAAYSANESSWSTWGLQRVD